MGAANTLADYIKDDENHCEWYIHMAGSGRSTLQIGRDTVHNAISRRHHHQDYMADYPAALRAVHRFLDNRPAPRLTSA